MRVTNYNHYSCFLPSVSKAGLVVFLFLITLGGNAFAIEEAFHPFHDYSGHLDVELYDYDGENENKDQKEDNSSKNQSLPEFPPLEDGPPATIEV